MSAIEYLRFYWPIVMVVVFFMALRRRIDARAEFCLFALLTLFGISRLVSSDVVPLLVRVAPPRPDVLITRVLEFHYAGQIVAAACGLAAVTRLSKRYSSAPRKPWSRATRPSSHE